MLYNKLQKLKYHQKINIIINKKLLLLLKWTQKENKIFLHQKSNKIEIKNKTNILFKNKFIPNLK